MGSLTSCNDFLDREPLDKVTPEKFFSAEADLAAYAINNYKFVTVDDKYGINLFGKDNDTDNQASGTSNSFWIPGEKKVAADRGEWKWEDIRSCNYFFDQVLPRYEEGAITGNQDNVKHYIGEMYVNRAYSYFQLFTKFGDLPIVTTALPDIQGELVEASKRQPRHKVARFIIEDLKKAEDMLLNNPPGGKNRISKNVAYLLHARVALYEATWEKYHRGTAFVPGGSGWPGKDAQGYDADVEINYFLDEAIAAYEKLFNGVPSDENAAIEYWTLVARLPARHNEGITQLKKLNARLPDNVKLQTALAKQMFGDNKPEEGFAYLEQMSRSAAGRGIAADIWFNEVKSMPVSRASVQALQRFLMQFPVGSTSANARVRSASAASAAPIRRKVRRSATSPPH